MHSLRSPELSNLCKSCISKRHRDIRFLSLHQTSPICAAALEESGVGRSTRGEFSKSFDEPASQPKEWSPVNIGEPVSARTSGNAGTSSIGMPEDLVQTDTTGRELHPGIRLIQHRYRLVKHDAYRRQTGGKQPSGTRKLIKWNTEREGRLHKRIATESMKVRYHGYDMREGRKAVIAYHYERPNHLDSMENMLDLHQRMLEEEERQLNQNQSDKDTDPAPPIRLSSSLSSRSGRKTRLSHFHDREPSNILQSKRRFHTAKVYRQEILEDKTEIGLPPNLGNLIPTSQRQPDIRERLKLWQEQYGLPNADPPQELDIETTSNGVTNNLTRLGNYDDLRRVESEEELQDKDVAAMRQTDEPEEAEEPPAVLHRGDLVELS